MARKTITRTTRKIKTSSKEPALNSPSKRKDTLENLVRETHLIWLDHTYPAFDGLACFLEIHTDRRRRLKLSLPVGYKDTLAKTAAILTKGKDRLRREVEESID